MLINLADMKDTGKFYKKFIFNICKCMTKFSLMEVEGRWMVGGGSTTQVVSLSGLAYPIIIIQLPPNYPKLPSSKPEQPKRIV